MEPLSSQSLRSRFMPWDPGTAQNFQKFRCLENSVLFALYSLVLKDLGPSAKTLRQVPVAHWNFPIPKYIPIPLLKALRLS